MDRQDTIHINDAVMAGVIKTGQNVHDTLGLKGKYTWTHWRVVPQFKEEYLELQRDLDLIESFQRMGILGVLFALICFGSLFIEKVKATIQLDMQSMLYVVDQGVFNNLVTTQGKNHILDSALAGSNYTATFYGGLIASSGYSAIAGTDTMASHPGWVEAGQGGINPSYSQSTRPTISWSAASNGSKSFSSSLSFSVTAPGTFKGLFISSNNTKGGTTGVLLSAGLFSNGDREVVSTDVFTVSYTMNS